MKVKLPAMFMRTPYHGPSLGGLSWIPVVIRRMVNLFGGVQNGGSRKWGVCKCCPPLHSTPILGGGIAQGAFAYVRPPMGSVDSLICQMRGDTAALHPIDPLCDGRGGER